MVIHASLLSVSWPFTLKDPWGDRPLEQQLPYVLRVLGPWQQLESLKDSVGREGVPGSWRWCQNLTAQDCELRLTSVDSGHVQNPI